MKKYFSLALVVAAGLFASCSSEDDVISEANGARGIINDGDRAPIVLTIGNPSSTYTRGTGTVGSLTTDVAGNVWAGQTFKVSMFDKGTLTYALSDLNDPTSIIYQDEVFTSPNVAAGVTADATAKVATATADGGLSITEEVSYFPQEGNFDFWAYRLDDAETSAPALNGAGDAMEAGFTIDGSQDIMVAKAVPGAADNGDGTWGTKNVADARVFSAYSVRRGVSPVINFNHLLTRLQFKVQASEGLSVTAANPAAPTPAEIEANPYAVRVTAIKVQSLSQGTLATAYTTEPAELITWTPGSEAALSLKERGRTVATPATYVFTDNMYTGADDAVHNFSDASAGYSRNDNPLVYDANTVDVTTGFPNGNSMLCSAAVAAGWTEFYAAKKTGNIIYGATDVAEPLIALNAVTPLWDNSTGTPEQYATPVGEALLVAPQADGSIGYQLTIEMEQDVVANKKTVYYNVVDASAQAADPTAATVTYYFSTKAKADAAQAAYDAWAAVNFVDGPEKTVWETARDAGDEAGTAAATEPIVLNPAPADITTYPSSKTITLKGKATASAGGTTYAPFEAGKNYTVTITLNGLEDVQAGSTPGGYTPGDDLDIILDEE